MQQGGIACHRILILLMIPENPLSVLIIFLPLGNDQGAHHVGGLVRTTDQLPSLRKGNVLLSRSALELISLRFAEFLSSLIPPAAEERTDSKNSSNQVNVDLDQTDKSKQKYNAKGLTKRRKKNRRHSDGTSKKSCSYLCSSKGISRDH